MRKEGRTRAVGRERDERDAESADAERRGRGGRGRPIASVVGSATPSVIQPFSRGVTNC